MKIALLGKFKRLHDEEYIARSFEILGHSVKRIDERLPFLLVGDMLEEYGPDIVLWTKLTNGQAKELRDICRKYTTVCWVFDLYIGYARENRLNTPAFTADYVFTTDGGHDAEFKAKGINHKCVRQGIYKDECVLLPFKDIEKDLVFVGSDNPYNTERNNTLKTLSLSYKLSWIGKDSTNECRGLDLNELYSKSRIIVGDSVYSPHYWSNRVVETLGRGGFLIHREVEGLKEEYPYLVTYKDLADLKSKIEYYKNNEEERRNIIIKNHEWVKDNYTMDKKCQALLNYVKV